MATERFYKPGSFYRVDDLTGFSVRAERTSKQWNNYIVRNRSWEPRNAQDFVRGRRDDQVVPDPRPRSPNVFLGANTTLSVAAPIRATAITVNPFTIAVGNVVSIMLDSQVIQYAKVLGIAGQVLTLDTPLPAPASSGNAVINTNFVAVQPQSFASSVS